jgi:hypothetical protein
MRMPRPIRSPRPSTHPVAALIVPTDPGASAVSSLPPWRGLYVVEPEPRDLDGLLALRGTRWHAESRFLAAFAKGMRRLL